MLFLFCIVFLKDTFAGGLKPITSWKDIVIGKTTEEEIISGNLEGKVNLSVTELLKLAKGQNVLRVLDYGLERSYAEAERKYTEELAFERTLPEWNKDFADALEFLNVNPKPKLEDYLKPALLNNGPIDLRWDKLGCAKLEIVSNGIVLAWSMRYWFCDPNNPDSLREQNKYFPTKQEVLEMFEIALGKPEKILKPDSQYDVYVFVLDNRKLELKLWYFDESKVSYVEFREGDLSKLAEEKDKIKKKIADFALQHKDFEQVRPIMYKLSLDPKNKDLSLQELYDMAKKQIKNKY